MDPRANRLLTVTVFTLTLLGSSSESFASKRMEQISRSNDVDRALSANESMLMRFRQERDELVRSRPKSKEQHLYKNRLKILNSKIDFLEKELARRSASPAKQPAFVASARKEAARPAPALKPLSVRWKAYRKTEPRRGYLMAWSSSLVKMRPYAAGDGRYAASQAQANARVVPQRPLGSEKRVEPAEAVERVKIQPRDERVLSERLKPETMPVTEKVSGKARSPKKGEDWKNMSRADKEIYILSVMGNLSKRDVYLMKPYSYYIEQVDKAVAGNPSMTEEYVHRILILNAYESEPDTRKDLEKVWR